MFIFKINYYFIILCFTFIFIISCNQTDITNSNIIIDNTIRKPILINKNIIANQIIKKKNFKIINEKSNVKFKKFLKTNDNSKIIKKKLNLLDSIASNTINENDVVFEFRNERLLQGREALDTNMKAKKALTAVFKMLKRNPSLENSNLNLQNNLTKSSSIDYLLNSRKNAANIVVKNILVFLPFTGPYSNFGSKIRQAIDLSVLRFGSDIIKVIYFDTGTNYLLEDIESIIQKSKPNLVLGPFTRASVLKIKPYVKKKSIPMFAFTNDIALVEENIWSLGFSPEEQIDSVMSCALDKGHKKYGLIVPKDLYGEIILNRSIDNLSIIPNTSFKQLLLSNTEMKNKPRLAFVLKEFLSYNKEQEHMSSSKFDAILIGGNKNFILEIAPLLAFYDVDSKKVQILGTEIFDNNVIKDEPSLEGAWFPIILDKEERNELIMFYKEEDRLKAIKEDLKSIKGKNDKQTRNILNIKKLQIKSERKARIKQKDFKLLWENIWKDDDNYFSKVGFDTGILAINFVQQEKNIDEYVKNIEGLVTGFKFKANGYVKKSGTVVEIQKLGKLKKIRRCFNNY